MTNEELKKLWLQEEEHAFSGWDFSYLKDRWISEPIPWNYKEIVVKYLNSDMVLLDMDTGGGEFLLTLNHPYGKTCVTEGWEPNVKLCMEKLSPLGISVSEVTDMSRLPFEDCIFDIIINRHGDFDLAEIYRVLKPGGYFITQQVGHGNNDLLCEKLIGSYVSENPANTVSNTAEKAENLGFRVEYKNETRTRLIFKDVGAVVFAAKILVWEFPGFSVRTHFDNLLKLQKELEETGEILSYEDRYMLVARKL